MKNIKQLREEHDLITKASETEGRKFDSLVRAGLFDAKKLPMLKRALSKDSRVMTPAERTMLMGLLDNMMHQVLNTNQIYSKMRANLMEAPKDSAFINDPRQTTPSSTRIPAIIVLRRKAIRTYPDNQTVALYYAQTIDKYVSIPFGAELNVATVNEGAINAVADADNAKIIPKPAATPIPNQNKTNPKTSNIDSARSALGNITRNAGKPSETSDEKQERLSITRQRISHGKQRIRSSSGTPSVGERSSPKTPDKYVVDQDPDTKKITLPNIENPGAKPDPWSPEVKREVKIQRHIDDYKVGKPVDPAIERNIKNRVESSPKPAKDKDDFIMNAIYNFKHNATPKKNTPAETGPGIKPRPNPGRGPINVGKSIEDRDQSHRDRLVRRRDQAQEKVDQQNNRTKGLEVLNHVIKAAGLGAAMGASTIANYVAGKTGETNPTKFNQKADDNKADNIKNKVNDPESKSNRTNIDKHAAIQNRRAQEAQIRANRKISQQASKNFKVRRRQAPITANDNTRARAANDNIQEEIIIAGNTFVINSNIKKKLLEVYSSLNKINQRKMIKMMKESDESFDKVIDFVTRI